MRNYHVSNCVSPKKNFCEGELEGLLLANKRKPLPPPPTTNHNVKRFKCTYKDVRLIEISVESLYLDNLTSQIQKKFGSKGPFVIHFKVCNLYTLLIIVN